MICCMQDVAYLIMTCVRGNGHLKFTLRKTVTEVMMKGFMVVFLLLAHNMVKYNFEKMFWVVSVHFHPIV